MKEAVEGDMKEPEEEGYSSSTKPIPGAKAVPGTAGVGGTECR